MIFFFKSFRDHRNLHSFPTRRSSDLNERRAIREPEMAAGGHVSDSCYRVGRPFPVQQGERSEEHTSELQSHSDLVCRLLLEKKNNSNPQHLGCTSIIRQLKYSEVLGS